MYLMLLSELQSHQSVDSGVEDLHFFTIYRLGGHICVVARTV